MNEIEKAFILVKIKGNDGLMQVALNNSEQEALKSLLIGGVFCEPIVVIDKIVADIEE